MADVETRTEPELKHLAVEAGGDACPQAGDSRVPSTTLVNPGRTWWP
jgi:hypothetical protein